MLHEILRVHSSSCSNTERVWSHQDFVVGTQLARVQHHDGDGTHLDKVGIEGHYLSAATNRFH